MRIKASMSLRARLPPLQSPLVSRSLFSSSEADLSNRAAIALLALEVFAIHLRPPATAPPPQTLVLSRFFFVRRLSSTRLWWSGGAKWRSAGRRLVPCAGLHAAHSRCSVHWHRHLRLVCSLTCSRVSPARRRIRAARSSSTRTRFSARWWHTYRGCPTSFSRRCIGPRPHVSAPCVKRSSRIRSSCWTRCLQLRKSGVELSAARPRSSLRADQLRGRTRLTGCSVRCCVVSARMSFGNAHSRCYPGLRVRWMRLYLGCVPRTGWWSCLLLLCPSASRRATSSCPPAAASPQPAGRSTAARRSM